MYKYYPGRKKGRAYFQTYEAADNFAYETSLYYLTRNTNYRAGWVVTWYDPDEAPAS